MKRTKKIMLRVLPILLVLMVVVTTNVFAINAQAPAAGNAITGITGKVNDIWATIAAIIQIAAIAAIILAGVRYMFASADTKADIKGQTIILVVGAVLVFAAVPLAQFIQRIANDMLK